MILVGANKNDGVIRANIHKFTYMDGRLYWSIDVASNAKKGSLVGSKNSDGYLLTSIDGVSVKVHRIVWAIFNMNSPENIDHINRVRDDNRIENLRASSSSLNSRNRNISSKNSSGFTGVSFNSRLRKWVACIYINGKQIYLGLFDDPNKASEAYMNAKVAYHGQEYILEEA